MGNKIIMLSCIMVVIQFISGCSNNNATKHDVVKITKTRTYSSKYEFDKIVIDKPEHDLGYDEKIGLDFSWRTRHLDRYNNILYFETLYHDQKGEEKISTKTTQEYYLPSEGKLKLIKVVDNYGSSSSKEFIRNNEGQLLELKEMSNNELINKTVYTSNLQELFKTEEDYDVNGLYERRTYYYEKPPFKKDNYIKFVREGFRKSNFKIVINYERNPYNQIIIERYTCTEDYKLLADLTTCYYDYIGKKATRIMKEGYKEPFVVSDEPRTPKRTIIEIKLNSYGDIIEYKGVVKDLIEKEHYENPFGNLVYQCDYKLDYTYNERKDWTKIIFRVNDMLPNNKAYIVTREIQYLD